MTQVDQYKGKLGFEIRDPDALSSGSTAVVDTLEEYGHSVRQFQSRNPNLIRLDCDHYRVELRYRRHPIKPTQASAVGTDSTETPLRSSLGVTLTPNHPDHCDTELSEMLLAMILRRLAEDLDVATVDWLHVPFTLTRDAFLGVFEDAETQVEPHAEAVGDHATLDISPVTEIAADIADSKAAKSNAPLSPQTTPEADAPVATPIDAALDTPPPVPLPSDGPKPVENGRLRGRACFEPVEVTVAQLEEHYAAMLQSPDTRATGRHAVEACNRARARAKAVMAHPRGGEAAVARLGGVLAAMPQRIIATTVHLLRSPQLRGHLHIVCGATALLALQSSAAIAF
ncbi:hypothetical protein [Phaeobacter gallaeciensis]|uniref:Uncharacterized protein n=1 Tax=Phaeobacter gallaeciensis TaxID=60890 RepID=A0AAC9Z852_9RHOB|nr:hypothetical protein [Phaeobacter gallaeciensis]AHD09282.1 hypothetical protein Gal_01520 [Phaeobacter gallaeciensis DSM 26640]ATE92545.1 hypothetical protein PhaeoP11_01511 [Phaeobacter gallaeciensis]ATE97633.1 hypothetical protein PhaeoP73_02335 [Phaeobacter gallaeciensis]ATF01210.1 hypothetical protein PhaeoP75_01561 [Phaeobacter gallaeciensis]ATF05590.1 hypothetical protein PhaeoP63_01509 [Phaeobacter gallaeciensis]